MTRDTRYRVNVLRGGAVFGRLAWAEGSAPSITVSRDATIKASFAGTFFVPDGVDLLTDELQPVRVADGVETPLGVFLAATHTREVTRYGMTTRIEAYDRCWRLENQRTQSLLHIRKGTPYLTIIQQLMTAAGIKLILATPSGAVLASDREDWAIGTSHLTIINQLLGEINYNDVWFDGAGLAHLTPYTQPDAARIDHAYSATDLLDTAPISPDLTDEADYFSAPNVFVRICSNPDLEADMVSTAVNESPVSRISVTRRGMRIVDVQRLDNIASQKELQAAADRARNESMLAARTISFSTLGEAGHGVGDILSIDDAQVGGIYEETGWTLTLAAGALMQHTAKRTVIA